MIPSVLSIGALVSLVLATSPLQTIPGGAANLGSEARKETLHATFRYDILTAKFEVTIGEFGEFLESAVADGTVDESTDGYRFRSWLVAGDLALSGDPSQPVAFVTWHGAALYCNWLSVRAGLDVFFDPETLEPADVATSTGFRLPTEAEWERAARGPEGYRYGAFPGPDFRRVNVRSGMALPVDSESMDDVNGFGLSGYWGNVWEWVINTEGAYPDSAENPMTWSASTPRSGVRGGGFRDGPSLQFDLSSRCFAPRTLVKDDLGFRIVRTIAVEERPEN